MSDWQVYINGGLLIISTAVGWFVRQIWEALQALKTDLKNLEVKIPEVYVRRDDFKASITEVKEDMKELRQDMKDSFNKIDSTLNAIYRKLDTDKPN